MLKAFDSLMKIKKPCIRVRLNSIDFPKFNENPYMKYMQLYLYVNIINIR